MSNDTPQLKVGQVYRWNGATYVNFRRLLPSGHGSQWTDVISGRRLTGGTEKELLSALRDRDLVPVTWPEPGQVWESGPTTLRRTITRVDGDYVHYRCAGWPETVTDSSMPVHKLLTYSHLVAPQPAQPVVTGVEFAGDIPADQQAAIRKALVTQPAQEPEIRVGQVWHFKGSGICSRTDLTVAQICGGRVFYRPGAAEIELSLPVEEWLALAQNHLVLDAPAPVEPPTVEPAPKPACVCLSKTCKECWYKLHGDRDAGALMAAYDAARVSVSRASLPRYDGLRTGVGGIVGGMSQWKWGR